MAIPEKYKIKPSYQVFVDEYIICGSQAKAYKIAFPNQDYTKGGVVSNAVKLMKRKDVQAYLSERLEDMKSERLASMTEVHEFWTNIMRNQHERTENRLRASEYIARTSGAFIDKVEHSGEIQLQVGITWE